LIEVSLLTGALPDRGTVVVAVGLPASLGRAAAALDETSGGTLSRVLQTTGPLKHGKTIDIVLPQGLGYDRVVLLGVGKPEGLKQLDREELGGGLARKLQGIGIREAVLGELGGLELGATAAEAAADIARGAALATYAFRKYQKPEPDEETRFERLTLQLEEPAGETYLATIEATLAAVAYARDLVTEPANILYPESFAKRCLELEKLGCEVRIMGPAELERLGMRAILAVGQGSVRPPYAVVIRWRGSDDEKPIALVGKGVCFDTGGISLKPAAGMEEMKWDMGGAAAVVGAMHGIAGRKAKAHVVGVIGLVENMPSGSATRPGDVISAMSGKTIEVVNTDAEGRLVLADLLHYTKEELKPAAMIDLATLTGAVVVALGHENGGLFATDEALASTLLEAAKSTGEGLWRLPLGKPYSKHIKSQIADIKNVGRGREAGATAGAVFLQEFVGDVPWAHLDIAGVTWSSRDLPLAPKGATGFGVRLLDEAVRAMREAGKEEAGETGA
jgi:leucyl aminopeptidase